MDTKTISFSHQGNWENNMGVAFENVALATCVTPALSAHAGSKFKFNLGRKAFVHAPPDSKYKPLYSWIVDHTEKVVSHETKTFRNPAASLKTIHLTNTRTDEIAKDHKIKCDCYSWREQGLHPDTGKTTDFFGYYGFKRNPL